MAVQPHREKERVEHRSVPVDSVFLPRSHAQLMRCVCGKADLSTRCLCALPPQVLKLSRSATELSVIALRAVRYKIPNPFCN